MSTLIAPSAPDALPAALTGLSLARQRLALGCARRAVARAAGWHSMTLERIERQTAPLAAEKRTRYEQALTACAQERAEALARAGFTRADLPRDLRAALDAYAPEHAVA